MNAGLWLAWTLLAGALVIGGVVLASSGSLVVGAVLGVLGLALDVAFLIHWRNS